MEQGNRRVFSLLKPCWVVCEDGREYIDRCQHFLAQEFDFLAAGDLRQLRTLLQINQSLSGILLDLDFRRASDQSLVDDQGRIGLATAQTRKPISEIQGILILRALRKQGIMLPAILCADLDDLEQINFLKESLAPLEVSPSSESVMRLAVRMRALSS